MSDNIYPDHPRRCGENRVRLKEHLCGLGSPPQVRGKLISVRFSILRIRITPAGAGKTHRLRRCYGFAAGSPPQVRGKLYDAFLLRIGRRITPAGAGKTNG